MNSLFRHRRFSGADENNMALKRHLIHIRGKINMENTLYFFVQMMCHGSTTPSVKLPYWILNSASSANNNTSHTILNVP